MKFRLFFLACLTFLEFDVSAQRYLSDKSEVHFFSSAAIEDIEADNSKSSSAFNMETGEIVFSVPITQFQFDKALMQEHFNEKYMESDKYPKSTFSGKLEGYENKSGSQDATAKGKLTIHGITKDVEINGKFEIVGERVKMDSKFMVALEDYEIEIPKLLWQNIAEVIEVTIAFEYKKYE